MSSCKLELFSRVIGEYYGDIVETVASCVAKNGSIPLRLIAKHTSLKLNQVKKAISVLLQHNILTTINASSTSPVLYVVDLHSALLRPRYPYYIYAAKQTYGSEAELIVEEMLRHGQIEMEEVLGNVIDRLKESLEDKATVNARDVYSKFVVLAENHFIQRCPPLAGCVLEGIYANSSTDRSRYDIPKIDIGELERKKRKRTSDSVSDLAPPAKKSRLENMAVSTERVYWRVNTQRFNEILRDETIVNCISRKFDKPAAAIIQTLLRLQRDGNESAKLARLSFNEIVQALPAELNMSRAAADQWLKILVDTASDFISRDGDSGGGIYSVDFLKAFRELCATHIESVLQERFGSKCRRIFRLLLMKQRLEEKQILDLTMISDKGLLRRLLNEQFVTLTEVPRALDFNPHKTIYLFSVNLNQVARMLLDRSYKALSNLITRRQTLTKEHEGLLTQEQRLEAILAQLEPCDASIRQEYEEQISPAERAQLTKFKNMVKK